MGNDFDTAELRARHLYDGLEEDPCLGQECPVPGPAGSLEAMQSYPAGYDGSAPVAVVCHPHPLYGGSMANKVVHMLSDTFNALGAATVRFNFRGVGASQGRFDQGRGETEDVLAVVRWVRERHPAAPLWLAGFSFGAYVALRAQPQVQAERVLLVAPPVNLFDFEALPPCGAPCLVIQGGRDDIVPPEAVSNWVFRHQVERPAYRWLGDADHFFHGRLNRLREVVQAEWAHGARPAG
ncbi:alpha/beta fold hydrolase [Ectothiorhodospiraceae bacterium 2226]|nr:alpha/beta fold hydrolase [Ectothiorhodospiraceae bacterium 2226]